MALTQLNHVRKFLERLPKRNKHQQLLLEELIYLEKNKIVKEEASRFNPKLLEWHEPIDGNYCPTCGK